MGRRKINHDSKTTKTKETKEKVKKETKYLLDEKSMERIMNLFDEQCKWSLMNIGKDTMMESREDMAGNYDEEEISDWKDYCYDKAYEMFERDSDGLLDNEEILKDDDDDYEFLSNNLVNEQNKEKIKQEWNKRFVDRYYKNIWYYVKAETKDVLTEKLDKAKERVKELEDKIKGLCKDEN